MGMEMRGKAVKWQKFIIAGEQDAFLLVFKRIIKPFCKNFVYVDNYHYEEEIQTSKADGTLIILNTEYDTANKVNEFMWQRLRLNEQNVGKNKAGLPVLVIGSDSDFLNSPSGEGYVFKKHSPQQKYITKPLNLFKCLWMLNNLSRIDPNSLSIINECAPDSLINRLKLDLFDADRITLKKKKQEIAKLKKIIQARKIHDGLKGLSKKKE